MQNDKKPCRRGDIFYAHLDPVEGSEQGGTRPVLIIQNTIGNRYSPTVIVAVITAKIKSVKQCTHVVVDTKNIGLNKSSMILLEHIRTIDRCRLIRYQGHLTDSDMGRVDYALCLSLELDRYIADKRQRKS